MRKIRFALLVGVALALVSASSALADTSGGGGADLGLEAVSINAGSVVGKTGEVTLTGSIGCTQDVEGFVYVDVAQVVGRFHTIRGWGETSFSCLAAGGSAAFSISILADQGRFAPGAVRVSAGADTGYCDVVGEVEECFYDSASFGPASIRIKGGK